ncbi:MAG: cell division inhibitor SulA [Salibacteraceae bacterium]|jgi:cell division inhibitor SulA
MDRVNIHQPVLTNMLLIPVDRKLEKQINVSYDSMISSKSTMRIYSQLGGLVFEKELIQSDGYNRTLLNIKGFEKGNYRIVIEDDFGNKISKSLVIHSSRGQRKF